jgi:hypothetical protein
MEVKEQRDDMEQMQKGLTTRIQAKPQWKILRDTEG